MAALIGTLGQFDSTVETWEHLIIWLSLSLQLKQLKTNSRQIWMQITNDYNVPGVFNNKGMTIMKVWLK